MRSVKLRSQKCLASQRDDDVLYSPNEISGNRGYEDQQNAIDKIKGIVCNPMPSFWYDYHANALPDNATEEEIERRDFNIRILADKKPYFMRYIYPTLMKQYNEYIKNTNTKCVREFRMTLDELLAIEQSDRTEEQNNFISYYEKRIPVGMHNCVMNRICRKFEERFDGISSAWKDEPFDYSILRSDAEYSQYQLSQFKKQYDEYNAVLKSAAITSKNTRKNDKDNEESMMITSDFRKRCLGICSNEDVLANILIDTCYVRSSTKKFVWDMCAGKMIENLANRNGGIIYYPERDDDGDIEFSGLRFSMVPYKLNEEIQESDDYDGDYSEREEVCEGSD